MTYVSSECALVHCSTQLVHKHLTILSLAIHSRKIWIRLFPVGHSSSSQSFLVVTKQLCLCWLRKWSFIICVPLYVSFLLVVPRTMERCLVKNRSPCCLLMKYICASRCFTITETNVLNTCWTHGPAVQHRRPVRQICAVQPGSNFRPPNPCQVWLKLSDVTVDLWERS